MSVKMSLTGVKEIDSLMKALPKELSHQVLGSAHIAAAKPLIEKEKLLAPEGPTGNLVDSIGGMKTPIKRADSLGEVKVGPRRSRPYKGFAGHLVEFGTKSRQTRKGANRGIMPADPFAEPAFNQTNRQVTDGIAVQIGRKLLSLMKRYV